MRVDDIDTVRESIIEKQNELKMLQGKFCVHLSFFDDSNFGVLWKYPVCNKSWLKWDIGRSYSHYYAPESYNRNFISYLPMLKDDKEKFENLKECMEQLRLALDQDIEEIIDRRFLGIAKVDSQIADLYNKAIKYVKDRMNELPKEIECLRDQAINLQINSLGDWEADLLRNYVSDWYDDWRNLPHVSGVYVLLNRGIDYIGESQDIRSRVTRSHNVYKYPEHMIGIVIADEQQRKEVETRLIRILRPKKNIRHNKPKEQFEFFQGG